MQSRAIRESQNQISDILQSIVEHEELQHKINLSHNGKGCNKNMGGGGGASLTPNIIFFNLKGIVY